MCVVGGSEEVVSELDSETIMLRAWALELDCLVDNPAVWPWATCLTSLTLGDLGMGIFLREL